MSDFAIVEQDQANHKKEDWSVDAPNRAEESFVPQRKMIVVDGFMTRDVTSNFKFPTQRCIVGLVICYMAAWRPPA